MNRWGKSCESDVLLVVDDGRRLTKVWGRFEHEDIRAECFKYKWGKRELVVFVPHDAVPRWESVPLEPVFMLGQKDFRVYGVRTGGYQGVGLDGSGSQLSVEQLSSFTLDNTAVKLSKSFREGGVSLKWIVIIGVILAAAVLGYMYMTKDSKKSETPAVPAPGTPTSVVLYE